MHSGINDDFTAARVLYGMRLRTARIAHGYQHQQALAAALGIAKSTVSRWERGLQYPSFEYALALQRLIGAVPLLAKAKQQPPPEDPADGETETRNGEETETPAEGPGIPRNE